MLAIYPADGSKSVIHVDTARRRIEGCIEWQNYEIVVEGSSSYRLFIDDVEPLLKPNTTNAWLWSAGFFAGEVLVELIDSQGRVCLEYRIDVSPDPNKLGRHDYAAMVDEIIDFDPALFFGNEAAQNSIGTDGSYGNAQLAYARLKLFGARFIEALDHVCRKPQTRLRHGRERRYLHQVRRMDSATIRSVARDPAVVCILRRRELVGAAIGPRLDVPSADQTVDIPANRTILALTYVILRRVRQLYTEFENILLTSTEQAALDEIKLRLPRRLSFLKDLECLLRRIITRHPLAEVSRPEISAAGLNTIAAHPVYSRAYRLGWYTVRPGIDGDSADETLWASPTWQVYERWGFLQIINVVRRLLGNAVHQVIYPSARKDCIQFLFKTDFAVVNIYLQAWFPAHDQKEWHGFRSISGERFPDIVLTIKYGEKRHFIVFDAKYRVSRAGILSGMESAHIYRDSLRWNEMAPDAALILIPARGGAPWLEDPIFYQKQRVGVLPVSISEGTETLEHMIRDYLPPLK